MARRREHDGHDEGACPGQGGRDHAGSDHEPFHPRAGTRRIDGSRANPVLVGRVFTDSPATGGNAWKQARRIAGDAKREAKKTAR
ncbi:hypothetical protein LX15_004387 [Streptoalloteichus tenebrarius]|uniref:Uncharacterized protein n=1 Tax=Streptoalloteichus tenebrarius (strain ATCC 17920 / DSM 40477 / JCM 4838 / CBS 697.72 / NBRC 16177 / NCIMB 11028 / NRRL B-12390 / A12253. 1 / ISP 5477) TaxID=1933 RepID=A0ABT1HYR1_STRSD|nr:hypothetical protein [Streptoalloteichus tenebrarius]MCP2260667.1 hypothetical protein [Streptoalloteichus tenebrarius]BFF03802.1 hypothetical protein GCM10020241_54770 [Streptoalloteichus tenebrarius]